jgi:hypothetical protein
MIHSFEIGADAKVSEADAGSRELEVRKKWGAPFLASFARSGDVDFPEKTHLNPSNPVRDLGSA